MGTAIGIDVRDPGSDPSAVVAAVDAAFALLRDIDAGFSPFLARQRGQPADPG